MKTHSLWWRILALAVLFCPSLVSWYSCIAVIILFHFLTLSPLPAVCAQSIEEEAISIIDQSFKTLRSSTAAFDLLLKFKHIRSTEAINNHLMRKFNDILIQFCKEVQSCSQKNNNRNCPLTSSYPWLTVVVYNLICTVKIIGLEFHITCLF